MAEATNSLTHRPPAVEPIDQKDLVNATETNLPQNTTLEGRVQKEDGQAHQAPLFFMSDILLALITFAGCYYLDNPEAIMLYFLLAARSLTVYSKVFPQNGPECLHKVQNMIARFGPYALPANVFFLSSLIDSDPNPPCKPEECSLGLDAYYYAALGGIGYTGGKLLEELNVKWIKSNGKDESWPDTPRLIAITTGVVARTTLSVVVSKYVFNETTFGFLAKHQQMAIAPLAVAGCFYYKIVSAVDYPVKGLLKVVDYAAAKCLGNPRIETKEAKV